ncbi:coproporphyrinogen-III oxidase family protein [Schaalia sp. Marseille-Q2122]|uniref:coproporphyrinogen-III oxidase family protein n=1 Tax=Schaalia sp. Marseille-Q2122 TaxID=2736604 RepID=UPI00158AA25B|nr:coproporphyrinogen-III oxidase family protein [Schaalia sp. Marseille-Q2122]
MPPSLPEGIAWPEDGRLDPQYVEADAGRPFSVYLHVPFCTVRCGYCDFNTYTTGFGPGADRASYADTALAEMRLAASILDDAGVGGRPASTVFFGGGTPTLLPAADLARLLEGVRAHFGLAEGAEVTSEANPETVTPEYLQTLAESGFTRVSIGMQSAVPHVLATLDRTHTPERVPQVVAWAKDAGLDISVDLIYGTPGESLEDWRNSLEAAIAMAPDHISAYALVVEEGTKMGAQVARGELPTPDPDDEADKYELADELLGAAGYRWYEISNFARVEAEERGSGEAVAPVGLGASGEAGARGEGVRPTQLRHASQHNLAYWRDWDWWGIGPGAHSHVGALRWWNVKHPRAYAGRLGAGHSPAAAGEVLDAQTRELERVMLAVRTAEGIAIDATVASETIAGLIADGLIDGAAAVRGRAVLTLRGRLLVDYVTHRLMGN